MQQKFDKHKEICNCAPTGNKLQHMQPTYFSAYVHGL